MPDSDTVILSRPGTWPRRLRLALEAIVTVMANAYMVARSRAAGSPSKTVVLMGEKDDALWRAALDEEEDEVLDLALQSPDFLRDHVARPERLEMNLQELVPGPVPALGAKVIMRRHELRSTVMTSNRPIEDWGKLIGDVPSATAILDRFP